MPLPVSFASATIADNTINRRTGRPETSNTTVAITTLTAANVVAQQALVADLNAAVAAITLGVLRTTETTFTRNLVSASPAASVLAQRENKWLCRYHGNSTFQNFVVSYGTADLSLLDTGEEYLDILTASSPGNDFKVAFEAIVKSPNDSSESVTLDSVQFVGRNT